MQGHICFVHKSRKFPYFEPTLDYITLRNFGTVRPIFTKIASKVAQDSKEKSHESAVRGKKFPRNYHAKRRGGGGFHPPPPPGLIRVKAYKFPLWSQYHQHEEQWQSVEGPAKPHHPVMVAREFNRRQSIFTSFRVILSNTTRLSSFHCKDTRVQGSANAQRMPAMIAHLTWMNYLGHSRARAHHALQPRIMKLVKMFSRSILW